MKRFNKASGLDAVIQTLHDAVDAVGPEIGIGSASHDGPAGGQKESAEKKDQACNDAETYQFIHRCDLPL